MLWGGAGEWDRAVCRRVEATVGATVGAISRGPGVGLGDSSACER